MAATQITVTGDAASSTGRKEQVSPAIGAAEYTIPQAAIDNEPQGQNKPFSQVLLQAPGFSQDSFGQVHLRNEHANLQYRVNGLLLPDSISGFSQVFDTRIAQKIDILTGTMPAQFGFRTSGIVDVTTKSGRFDNGSEADIYGGSHNTVQPSLQTQGSYGDFDYYASGSYLKSSLGVENPTRSYEPVHDDTQQAKGFAFVSKALSPDTTLTAMLGSSIGYFQIPNTPGVAQQYDLADGSTPASSALNQRQTEYDHFGIVALQGSGDSFTYQLAPYIRYSETRFAPDATGDLAFNGFSDRSKIQSTAYGLQFDGSKQVGDTHTIRTGLLVNIERTGSSSTNALFTTSTGATNRFGNAQDSTDPSMIGDGTGKTGYFYGTYLQDEWQIAEKVTVNYGARFDVINAYTNENQISPRIDAVYRPWNGTALHMGYARNFTPPPQELVAAASLARFNDTTQASEVTTTTAVKAEREHYFDVGGTQILLPGLTGGLDAYYKIKRNLLDEGQFGESLIYSPFNYAFGRAYGIEASAIYDNGPVHAHLNIAYGEEKGKTVNSGQNFFAADELAYITTHAIHTDHDQKWTASTGLSYDFHDKAGTLTPSAEVIFGSGLRSSPADGSVMPNGTHLPSYFQLNAGISQSFDNATGFLQGVTLRVDMVNIADDIYEIRDGTGVGVGASQYGPRRAVFAGISKKF